MGKCQTAVQTGRAPKAQDQRAGPGARAGAGRATPARKDAVGSLGEVWLEPGRPRYQGAMQGTQSPRFPTCRVPLMHPTKGLYKVWLSHLLSASSSPPL